MKRIVGAAVAIAALAEAGVVFADDASSGPPANVHSISAAPIGSVGAKTAGYGGMAIICKLRTGAHVPAGATVDEIKASYCAR